MNNIIKMNNFNPFQNPSSRYKFKTDGVAAGVMEIYNEASDMLYNQRHPATKDDIFDKFNKQTTEMLYFADNFTPAPVGHFAASYGRQVRGNYEQIYNRLPHQDNFERSYEAFKRATEYDY